MPRFADYHRTIVGYHGSRRSTALRIVQGLEGYRRSENADDWLGHGVYFWEYAPKQAWSWAERRRELQGWGEEVAVLASMICLGNCFDLLDPDNLGVLSGFRVEYEKLEREIGSSPKENRNKSKYLDCAVFQFAYAAFDDRDDPVDSCRAVFVPSNQRLWSRKGRLPKRSHPVVCSQPGLYPGNMVGETSSGLSL